MVTPFSFKILQLILLSIITKLLLHTKKNYFLAISFYISFHPFSCYFLYSQLVLVIYVKLHFLARFLHIIPSLSLLLSLLYSYSSIPLFSFPRVCQAGLFHPFLSTAPDATPYRRRKSKARDKLERCQPRVAFHARINHRSTSSSVTRSRKCIRCNMQMG